MQVIELIGTYLFDPPNLTNKHEKQSSWKTTAFINFNNSELHMYYAWFIKKRYNLILNRPIRDPHLSFINDKLTNEQKEKYLELKKNYDGKQVSLLYSPELIRTNGDEWWLKCECKHAEQLRGMCGLDSIPFHPFHITIGSANEKNIEHSNYILRQIIKFNL